ncbi:MAG: 6-carboxytetrahydropterin synthase [Campylobacterota bacterium]|nr:6-carboxytetrahydropterin synthase [Campylobacterota bacterium]
MIIRKVYEFENAHVVRGCSTQKCRSSIHGHSYKVELLFSSNYLDNAHMVYDFGLMKLHMKELIDAFDHSITLWDKDDKEYISDMKKHSTRWVQIPCSPSAEQFSRLFFVLIEKLLSQVVMINGERDVKLHSVIAHETDTGYAQCFKEDAHSELMGKIDFNEIIFSDEIKSGWSDKHLYEKLLAGEKFINPDTV